MAYNTKSIITDVDGNPISQYYNPDTDKYEPLLGGAGANRVILYNEDGSVNNSLSLVEMLNLLSQLTGTVIDEETRKANEISRNNNEEDRQGNEDIRNRNETERVQSEDIRISNEGIRESNENTRKENELDRVNLYQDLMNKLSSGYFDGKNLEFHWRGTELGVRVEGDLDYVYVDLKGETGSIDNLNVEHIKEALGYTPADESVVASKDDLDEKVSKSGDVMNGNLKLQGSAVRILRPTAGGWALGLSLADDTDVNTLAGLGFYGASEDFRYSYIGVGSAPHTSDSNLRFYEDKTQVMKPLEEVLSGISNITTQEQFDNHTNTASSGMLVGTFYKKYISLSAVISIPMGAGGTWLLEGHKVSSTYEWQRLVGYQGGLIYFRTKNNSTWSEWYQIATNKPIPWINATLVGGWSGSIYYRKNSLGQLEIKMNIHGNGATSSIFCTLPQSYRPSSIRVLPLWKNTDEVIQCVINGYNGEIRVIGSVPNIWCYGTFVLPTN